jgi:hypothetical protein
MKRNFPLDWRPFLRAFYPLHIGIIGLWAMPRSARAQHLYVSNIPGGGVLPFVSEYHTKTGAAINPNFITGLFSPIGLAVSGNTLFVANFAGAVGKYNATTGAAISPSFIIPPSFPGAVAVLGNTGLNAPVGLAVLGNTLFVVNNGNTVGAYDATTGATFNANFITGLDGPVAIAVKNALFVANANNGTIGEYDASTGAVINANFITGLIDPDGLALLGNSLFVTDRVSGTIGKYNATTGAAINASLITGLTGTGPFALAVKRRKHHEVAD